MITKLQEIACRIRRHVLTMSHTGRAPHVASCLSCVDILVALYFQHCNIDFDEPAARERDRVLLSKGHAAATLYACLAERGFIPLELLDTFALPGSPLAEHPSYRAVQGIEFTSGSLGHGVGVGTGIALAMKQDNRSGGVYVVVSDGECNEGAIWEAALWAPRQGLGNLTVIVDYNKFQACGPSEEITQLRPLATKWGAFGWNTVEVDGHDLQALIDALSLPSDVPKVIVANTVKGKGISFMENDLEWHYRPPSETDLARALGELSEIRI